MDLQAGIVGFYTKVDPALPARGEKVLTAARNRQAGAVGQQQSSENG
jgi:hypothetical protein